MYKDMMDTIGFVSQFDPEVGQAMNEELGRQRRNLPKVVKILYIHSKVSSFLCLRKTVVY